MQFVGRVASKNINADGHSSVTLQGEVQIAKPVKGEEPKGSAVNITISSADVEVIEHFKVKSQVTIQL